MGQEPTFKQMAKRTGVNLGAHAAMQLILWSLPFLLSAMTVLAGYLQSVPWMYVIVAATFVFACAAAGALRLSEFRARITAQNKLGLPQILPAANFIATRKREKLKASKKCRFVWFFRITRTFQCRISLMNYRLRLKAW
jgi:hypothetical protein